MMDLRRRVMMAGGFSEDTATGNPLTFQTNLAKPLKSLSIPFSPIQASGTPSPSNVLPISGFTGVTAYRTGANLIDDTKRSIGTSSVYIGSIDSGYHLFLKAGTYTFSCEIADDVNYNAYIKEENAGSAQIIWSDSQHNTEATFTLSSDGMYRIYIKKTGGIDAEKIGRAWLNFGDTASEYKAYTGNTVSFDFPYLALNYMDVGNQTFTKHKYVGFSTPLATGYYAFTAKCVSDDTDDTKCRIAFMAENGTTVLAELFLDRGTEVTLPIQLTQNCYGVYMYASTDVAKSVGDTVTWSDIRLEKNTITRGKTLYGGTIDLATGILTLTHICVTFGETDIPSSINTISTISGGYTRFWIGVGYRVSRKAGTVPLCNKALANTTQGYDHYSSAGSYLGASDDYPNSAWCILPTSLVGTTGDSIKTALMDMRLQLVYEIRDQQTYQLTPQQIATIKGQNIIWTDTNGNNTAVFLKK